MTISRTFDMDAIRRVMRSPEIYNQISDDASPARAEYEPLADPRVYYVAVSLEGSIEGVFVCVPENAACLQVHTCLRKSLWGMSVEAALRAIDWVWGNTAFNRIVTNVPKFNRLAARLSKRSGMTLFGTNPQSFLKGGVFHDQEMYGITRRLACPQR